MKESEMILIARLIDETLANSENETKLSEIRDQVKDLIEKYPLYPGLR